jgi:hypothetical protein
MTAPDTPGAFLFGLRLMALDGAIGDMPDTEENSLAFGRASSGRGEGPFLQVQSVYLRECGYHAYGLMIAHYAVRFVMHEAALRQGVDPDRISFVQALRFEWYWDYPVSHQPSWTSSTTQHENGAGMANDTWDPLAQRSLFSWRHQPAHQSDP